MAQRIEKFSTVAAAGVSGQLVPHSFLDGTVTSLHLYIPDGHAGFTSWSFWYGTAQLLPKTAGASVTGNDIDFYWDLEDAPTGSGYQSKISNSDVFAHSFHVELWIDELGGAGIDEPSAPILILPYA